MSNEVPVLSSPGLSGRAAEYRESPIRLLEKGFHELGPVFQFRMYQHWIHIVADPHIVDNILRTNAKAYQKTVFTKNFKRLLGNGLLTSDGEFWRKQRRLSQPLFARTRLSDYLPAMEKHADALVARLREAARSGKTVDLHAEFMRVALEIIVSTMLHADLEPQDFAAFCDSFAVMVTYHEKSKARMVNWPEWVPVKYNREFNLARGKIVAIVKRIIAGFRRDPERSPSLLARLIEARDDETNEQMTDQQLFDEVFTFVAAGLDTSANLLTWAVYLMCRHPSVWEKVAEEAKAPVVSTKSAAEIFQSLPYTNQVLYESMRLYPPAFIIGRSPKDEEIVGEFRFPKGATLWISPYLLQRDGRVWEDPMRFAPERFAQMKSYDAEKRFIPFAKGPRVCIGKDFAMAESAIVLSRLARELRFELTVGFEVVPQATVTLRPKTGMYVDVYES